MKKEISQNINQKMAQEIEKVMNQALLPGYMREKGACSHTFTQWMKYRYSSGTNTMARRLKGITFGQGARMKINRETRALSFSDAYWLKDIDDSIRFEDISPYYKPFWDGSDEFSGQAAPTLYVGGALSKEWKQVAEDEYNLTHQENVAKQSLLALKSAMNFPVDEYILKRI